MRLAKAGPRRGGSARGEPIDLYLTKTGVALILLFLFACASPPPTKTGWKKDGGSATLLKEDRDSCLAETESTEPPAGSEWLNARLVGNQFVECMESKGWTRVAIHEE